MTPITTEDKAALCNRLKRYGPAVDPASVDYVWDTFSNPDVCGEFLAPRTVHLNKAWQDITIADGGVDDVICHELWHCGQYRSQGPVIYAIMNLSGLNEKSAYAEQERVGNLMGRLLKTGPGFRTAHRRKGVLQFGPVDRYDMGKTTETILMLAVALMILAAVGFFCYWVGGFG